MKINKSKEIIVKIIQIIIAAFLFALSVKLIVQPNKFLSGGVSGFTILVSRFIANKVNNNELESLLYSVLYIIFNIPIFIFGFKRVGKQFIMYSIVNVVLFSLFVSLIPSSWGTTFELCNLDLLTSAIIAGLLAGTSAVISFSNGFSSGGTDIISMYLSREKGKGIGNYNFIMNAFILLLGGIMFKDYDVLIYTVVYFFVNSLVVNYLYIGHKKVLLEIVTSKADDLVNKLMQESHHGCTIINAIGAYSQKEKKLLRIVIAANQTRRIGEIIKEIDSQSFTTFIEIKQINGKFYIPPIK